MGKTLVSGDSWGCRRNLQRWPPDSSGTAMGTVSLNRDLSQERGQIGAEGEEKAQRGHCSSFLPLHVTITARPSNSEARTTAELGGVATVPSGTPTLSDHGSVGPSSCQTERPPPPRSTGSSRGQVWDIQRVLGLLHEKENPERGQGTERRTRRGRSEEEQRACANTAHV